VLSGCYPRTKNKQRVLMAATGIFSRTPVTPPQGIRPDFGRGGERFSTHLPAAEEWTPSANEAPSGSENTKTLEAEGNAGLAPPPPITVER